MTHGNNSNTETAPSSPVFQLVEHDRHARNDRGRPFALHWPRDLLGSRECRDKEAMIFVFSGTYKPGKGRGKDASIANTEHRAPLVWLDYDKENPPGTMERASAHYGTIDHVVYTSYGHTPEAERFRIVLACSRTMSPDEYHALVSELAEQAEAGGVPFARESRDRHRCFYLPSHRPGSTPRYWHCAGAVFDVDSALEGVDIEPTPYTFAALPPQVLAAAALVETSAPGVKALTRLARKAAEIATCQDGKRAALWGLAHVLGREVRGGNVNPEEGVRTMVKALDFPGTKVEDFGIAEQAIREGMHAGMAELPPDIVDRAPVPESTFGEDAPSLSGEAEECPPPGDDDAPWTGDARHAASGEVYPEAEPAGTEHRHHGSAPEDEQPPPPDDDAPVPARPRLAAQHAGDVTSARAVLVALHERLAARPAKPNDAVNEVGTGPDESAALAWFAALEPAEWEERCGAVEALATVAAVDRLRKRLKPRIQSAQAELDSEAEASLRAARRDASDRRRAAAEASGRATGLLTDKKGNPDPCLRNMIAILDRDGEFAGRLRWNEFHVRAELDGLPLTDGAVTNIAARVAELYAPDAVAMRHTPSAMVHEAAGAVARRSPFHPVRDYLRSLRWDGAARAAHWLSLRCHAPDTSLNRAFAEKFLLSAVARAFQPGCQVDTTLILVGPEGKSKSSALRALGGEWFRDDALDIRNKDCYQSLCGVWLYEFAELESFRRGSSPAIRAFLSKRADNYRPPYGRLNIDQPRQGVFCGSTNDPDFLTDPWGSRRFWPVTVGEIDIKGLTADRPQLWAEAVALYVDDKSWHLDEAAETARVNASKAYRADYPWAGPVAAWVAVWDAAGRKSQAGKVRPFQLVEVLDGARVPAVARSSESGRVAAVLRDLGLVKAERHVEGVKAMHWSREDDIPAPADEADEADSADSADPEGA